MTATPGPNSSLVLAERPPRHFVVAIALRDRPDNCINYHGDRTPYVPHIRYGGTKGSAKLCPQRKTQAQGRPLPCLGASTRAMGLHHCRAYQQDESETKTAPTQVTLLRIPTQTQTGQICLQCFTNMHAGAVVQHPGRSAEHIRLGCSNVDAA